MYVTSCNIPNYMGISFVHLPKQCFPELGNVMGQALIIRLFLLEGQLFK